MLMSVEILSSKMFDLWHTPVNRYGEEFWGICLEFESTARHPLWALSSS